MAFDKFGIKNFRVFRNEANFEFAPITILTGTNSSGKSSLTKAMLLLKNSLTGKSDNTVETLNRNENPFAYLEKLEVIENLNIGNFSYWVNKFQSNDDIVFTFPFLFCNVFGLALVFRRVTSVYRKQPVCDRNSP